MTGKSAAVNRVAQLLTFGAVAAAALALPTAAVAQHFNCRAASLASEKAICASQRLSQLDERMSHLYSSLWNALEDDTAREGLRDYQLNFLSARDACGRNESCIRGGYLDQIEVLNQHMSRRDQ